VQCMNGGVFGDWGCCLSGTDATQFDRFSMRRRNPWLFWFLGERHCPGTRHLPSCEKRESVQVRPQKRHKSHPNLVDQKPELHGVFDSSQSNALANLEKGYLCQRSKQLSTLVKMHGKENHPAHRPANLFGKRCITFARGSMGRALPSRPSPSDCRRHDGPVSSCGLLAEGRPQRRPEHKPVAICVEDELTHGGGHLADALVQSPAS
jgi:hypothetical protein